jgi:hypothetical protein
MPSGRACRAAADGRRPVAPAPALAVGRARAAIGLAGLPGVHYPSDVLVGLALGVAVGWAVVALARRAVRARREDGARMEGRLEIRLPRAAEE